MPTHMQTRSRKNLSSVNTLTDMYSYEWSLDNEACRADIRNITKIFSYTKIAHAYNI